MKADRTLFLSICVFLLSVGICVVTLFNQDPRDASVARIVMFFVFLFFSIASLPISIFLMTAVKREKAEISLAKMVRRYSLASLGIVGLLLMSSFNILNLLSAITFVFSIFLSELFLESRSTQHHG
jgi:hypothetical protein